MTEDKHLNVLVTILALGVPPMVWPKVSIIWVNYNSMGIRGVILESLDSIASIDYPSDRYELIVVDNSSSDGSYILVEEFLSRKSGLRWRIVRLDRNRGYAGGVNEGFRVRDRDSKYVVAIITTLYQHRKAQKTS